MELPEGYGYADFHKFIVQHPQGREAFVQVPARQDGPYAFHVYLHSVWDAKMKIVEESEPDDSKEHDNPVLQFHPHA